MNIVVAGMPRAGTTWLYTMLSKHPDAVLPKLKETNFFCANYHKGMDWYLSLFENSGGDKVCFDISPFYFVEEESLARIRDSKEVDKVILLVRSPDEWVRSFYQQVKSYTIAMPSFDKFKEGHRFKYDGRELFLELGEFDVAGRVCRFIEFFGGRIMLINFDLIKSDPLALLKAVEKFAGLSPFYDESNFDRGRVNASGDKFSLFTYLSSIPFVKRAILKLVPYEIADKLRRKLVYDSAKNSEYAVSGKEKGLPLFDEQDILYP